MKKIEFRATAIIRIQKTVKMFLAVCRHKPRYVSQKVIGERYRTPLLANDAHINFALDCVCLS